MFRPTEAEAPGDDIFASMTYGHMNSGSPSTCLLYLRGCSRSLQTQWASCLATSSGARVPRTWVLISMLLNSMGKGWMGQLGPEDICTVASH
jgi:hypothetical protein